MHSPHFKSTMSNMGCMSGRGSVSPSSRYIISVIWTRVPGVRSPGAETPTLLLSTISTFTHHSLVNVTSRRIEDEVMFRIFAIYFEMRCERIVLIDVLVGTNFDIFKWGLYSVYCVARTIDLFAFFFVCKQPEYL